MGAIPEPALCADDVLRPVARDVDDHVTWLAPASRGVRSPRSSRPRAARLVASAIVGLGVFTALPDAAIAPAAIAHDRVSEEVRSELTPGLTAGVDFAGIRMPEESPPTPQLIEAELRALVRVVGNDRRADRDPNELLRFGDRKVRRGLVETILKAASATGTDPAYMMALADKESSFAPEVRASTSSAEGLFQFLTRTWLAAVREFGPRHGLEAEAAAIVTRDGVPGILDEAERERILALRRDPYVSALMAGELLKRDRARIERRLGRELKVSEFYFAHFLGTAGAGRLIELAGEKPKVAASRAFSAAARANRSLFMSREGRKRRALTVVEVYEKIDRLIDERLDRFADITALIGLPRAN